MTRPPRTTWHQSDGCASTLAGCRTRRATRSRAERPPETTQLGLGWPCLAIGAATDHSQMRQVHCEAAVRGKRFHRRGRVLGLYLPALTAVRAVEVAVFGARPDVELLAAVQSVRVAHDAQLLEHAQGPVNGRRRRQWIL